MANFEAAKIRNVAVIAHGGAGKTSLVEAMLFDAGMTDRLGSVQDGTTVTDFEPEEIDRKITITSALSFCNWNKNRINLIDTPGFINFIEDARGCLRVADGSIVVVSAVSGVKAETRKLWGYAADYDVPSIVFVNSMDKDTANFEKALLAVEKTLDTAAVALQIPIGSGDSFSGIVDLLQMKAYTFKGGRAEESAIAADMQGVADEYRKKLVERIAECNDTLLEKYLEGGEITSEELVGSLRECSLSIPLPAGLH
jgi:elongation factor G